ncbi:MAG TPA: ABC transporter permease, partial [Acidimicrobiia bacterium]|nr:ABC transporter permease [Acidimicrobiia bacterium]
IVGAVVAIIVVTSTLTFGTSLRTLVSHPPLYGWNWNYALLSGFGGNEDLPLPQVTALLNHDPYVSAWSGVYFADVTVDGTRVPAIAASPNATVSPPVLTGHALDQPNEIVLGATTLADLHKHVGDTVQVNTGSKRLTALRIVGTATLPAMGTSGNPHTTMGTGAIVDYQLIPPNQRNVQGSPIPGPNAVLIRIHRTTNPTAALRSLQQINNTINTPKGGGGDNAGGIVGVLRPAEIVNYRSMGTTPALLSTALAVGATAALALTLIASVRRRRRELALLKAIGFTRRQLAAVIAWQSTIAITIGVVVGVPLGIIAGRALWDLFARAIHAVPQPTIATTTVALIAIVALVLANVVAAIPGIQAARTRTALLLHAE